MLEISVDTESNLVYLSVNIDYDDQAYYEISNEQMTFDNIGTVLKDIENADFEVVYEDGALEAHKVQEDKSELMDIISSKDKLMEVVEYTPVCFTRGDGNYLYYNENYGADAEAAMKEMNYQMITKEELCEELTRHISILLINRLQKPVHRLRITA